MPFRNSLALLATLVLCTAADANEFMAGAAKVDITDREAGPVNDPLYVKALVIRSDAETFVLITVDAVAIGEIGRIGNDYLPGVRKRLTADLGIKPLNVMANASHCHGVVRRDVAELTVKAVHQAFELLEPVSVGFGLGREDRIMENRRLKLKSGRTIDVRHAYALPPDDEVEEVGPVDPAIGVLRLDRRDGSTLAVVYNFACHPILGVPSGANTADITGFASQVIEENLGSGAVAMFVQGCGGDINPLAYKEVDQPRDAEPLGNRLGLSVLRALRHIKCQPDDRLAILNETLTLPRGDRSERIFQLEAKQEQLLANLRGTTLNLKTFIPLTIKYKLAEEFPSYYSYGYLRDRTAGRNDLEQLDSNNRKAMRAYMQNIHTMEELTRVQTNLRLLRKHQASMIDSGKRTIDVEVMGIRVGNLKMITFPGELTVQIGLNIKLRSQDPDTLVAGYTNGYIYYAPTADQLQNVGGAQEDSDCILAPAWQALFETKALEMLGRL